MIIFKTESTVVSLTPSHITLIQVNSEKAEIYLLLSNGRELAIYDDSDEDSNMWSIIAGVRHKFKITTTEFDSLTKQLNNL